MAYEVILQHISVYRAPRATLSTMARPSFVRRFDVIDEVEQQHKKRRMMSWRELLIAVISSLVGAALMLAISSRDHVACRLRGSPVGLVETVFEYNRTFVISPDSDGPRQSAWDSLVPRA
jgi:hypothetical protein